MDMRIKREARLAREMLRLGGYEESVVERSDSISDFRDKLVLCYVFG